MTSTRPPRPPRRSNQRTAKSGVWRPRWWVALSSMCSFGVGCFGFVHEVLSQGERPTLLLACLVLMGAVPVVLLLERMRP